MHYFELWTINYECLRNVQNERIYDTNNLVQVIDQLLITNRNTLLGPNVAPFKLDISVNVKCPHFSNTNNLKPSLFFRLKLYEK